MSKKKATLELEKALTCQNCGIIQQTNQHCNACGWMPGIDTELQPINNEPDIFAIFGEKGERREQNRQG